ncbi:Hypothetical protein NTJ_06644 [Nesidiocoris tenuis]|uniref:Uncharacterized protein n=1 Tax=Nesidiocoris tenuis TaxID=355587 RepID=A0ABN7ANN1_9HEMI|nr:Hypothetical protein NTJ_06644 [Nesidiocoris tenuis]
MASAYPNLIHVVVELHSRSALPLCTGVLLTLRAESLIDPGTSRGTRDGRRSHPVNHFMLYFPPAASKYPQLPFPEWVPNNEAGDTRTSVSTGNITLAVEQRQDDFF